MIQDCFHFIVTKLNFNFTKVEAKVYLKIPQTKTTTDLISSQQHFSDVLKLVTLSYNKYWEYFGVQ